jgi:hypothetical protein
MSVNKNTSWSSQKFIALSQALGEAYLPGVEVGKTKNSEVLTVSKLIAANRKKTF